MAEFGFWAKVSKSAPLTLQWRTDYSQHFSISNTIQSLIVAQTVLFQHILGHTFPHIMRVAFVTKIGDTNFGGVEAGSCQVTRCDTGWDNCDNSPTNGCERPLNTLTDCGACGVACNLPRCSLAG